MKADKKLIEFLQEQVFSVEDIYKLVSNFQNAKSIDVSNLIDVVDAISIDKANSKRWQRIHYAGGSFERQAFLLYKAYKNNKWTPDLFFVFYALASCAYLEPILHKKEMYFDMLLSELTLKIHQ